MKLSWETSRAPKFKITGLALAVTFAIGSLSLMSCGGKKAPAPTAPSAPTDGSQPNASGGAGAPAAVSPDGANPDRKDVVPPSLLNPPGASTTPGPVASPVHTHDPLGADLAPDRPEIAQCWKNPALRAASVDGGDTGPFVREVTQPGMRSIEGCVKIPEVTAYGTEEDYTLHPHLYFGVNFANGQNCEIGLMFQAGTSAINRGFTPYIRRPDFNGQSRFTVFDRQPDGPRRMRFLAGDVICWRASYAAVSGSLKLELLPKTKLTLDPTGKKLAALFADLGTTLQAQFTPAGGPTEQNKVRFRRMTAIATAKRGAVLRSFDTKMDVPRRLGKLQFDVEWSDVKVQPLAGLPQRFRERIEYAEGNERCRLSVRWPLSWTHIDRCADGRELISLRHPDVREPFARCK